MALPFKKSPPLILAIIILSYLVLRVFIVPISDDEFLTYLHHVHNDLFTILTSGNPNIYWAPNNHILNTLFIKLSLAIFGDHDWAFRIHILLAFIICYYYFYKILSRSVPSPIRVTAYLGILFLNPYLLDFFSIARGYALSMAGWSAAMYFFILYYQDNASMRNLRNTIFSLFLAVWSNFSAVYFLPIFGLMFLFHFYQNRKEGYVKTHLMAVTGGVLAIAGIIAVPLAKALAAGTLTWGTGSFFQDTFVASMDYYSHYNIHMGRFQKFNENWGKTEVYTVALMTLWVMVQLFSLRLNTDEQARNQHYMSLFQCAGLVAIVVCLHVFFNTAYPYHRTALLFTFPFLLALFLALETITAHFNKSKILAYGMFLFCSWHCACTWNVENTMEWYLNGDAKRVFAHFEKEIEKNGQEKKIELGAEQWQYFSMAYYARTKYRDLIDLKFTTLKEPEQYEYLFAPHHLKNKVWERYRPVKEFKHGVLFKFE